MFPKEVEVILARHLASYLAMPIFIVDPQGTLVYFNEAAESILGRRYEETGEMPAEEWSTVFTPTDEAGHPLAPDDLPLIIALKERRPAFRRMHIIGLNGRAHRIAVTAFPLVGQSSRFLGAMAIFWKEEAAGT
jgi:PAS domain-containing protein